MLHIHFLTIMSSTLLYVLKQNCKACAIVHSKMLAGEKSATYQKVWVNKLSFVKLNNEDLIDKIINVCISVGLIK